MLLGILGLPWLLFFGSGGEHGFTLAKSVEMSRQWVRVLLEGPVGPVAQVEFLGWGGLPDFHTWIVS